MKPKMFFTEKFLTDSIKYAVKKSLQNPYGVDPFGAELKSAMDRYAFTLPSCFQNDRITTKETIPSKRQVTVTSNQPQDKPSNNKLIKEVRNGVITLSQPIMYIVNPGDTLLGISWKLTGRRASVQDLINWNKISGDIKLGQTLWLIDPNNGLVKEACANHSKSELKSRNPRISLEKLSPGIVAQYGGLFQRQYRVQIKLKYNEPWENFLNPYLLNEILNEGITWTRGFFGGNGLGDSVSGTHYPEEVSLGGGDFRGDLNQNKITNDVFKHQKTTSSIIQGGACGSNIVEAEYLAPATINNAIKGLTNVPIQNSLKTIAKTAKIGGYTGIVASWGIGGTEYYNGTDHASIWVDAGVNTLIFDNGSVTEA